MAERFTTADHRVTSILASIDRVHVLVADPSTLVLNRNQCAYVSEAQQAAGWFLRREDVRTRIHDGSINIGSSESKASAALIQLDSVVKRAENLVQQCCRSNAWPKGALTLFAVKYDVLDICIHLWWWISVLRMVIDVPSSKLTAVERVQLLNREFELKLLSFDKLELVAEDDKRELLKKVKAEVQARNGELPDTAHLLLLQVHSLLTDQDKHSNPQLNKFTHGRLLGQGSFGVVHRVKWCGYDCVLKQYWSGEADDVEVKSLKTLQHPHIVRFLRHWKSEGIENYNSHILMEGMEGDLQDHISAKKWRAGDTQPFPLPVAIDIMLQVMRAVWHMHERHIVHRDLKPKNVLVRKSAFLPEGYVEVKLGDFGIAKADMMTSNVGALTYKQGTNQYRAPELSSREYTQGASRNLPRRIDMWSFGIMCSQILTGLPPFSGLEGNALHEHIAKGGRPSVPDDCPGYLRYCIESCWQLKPENRPRASDMWRMLRIAQLRMLGLVNHSCDSLFGFTDHSNMQSSQFLPVGPVQEGDPEDNNTVVCVPVTGFYERAPEGTNENEGSLSVTIVRAEEVEGKYHTNPFVEVHFRGAKKKTKVVKKNSYPRWDDKKTFRLMYTSPNDRLRIKVLSKGSSMNMMHRQESLGWVDIALSDVVKNRKTKGNYSLAGCTRGKILVELEWYEINWFDDFHRTLEIRI